MINKEIQNIYYSILVKGASIKQSDNEIDVQCMVSRGITLTNDMYLLLPDRIVPSLNVSYWDFVEVQPWGPGKRVVRHDAAYSYWGVEQ